MWVHPHHISCKKETSEKEYMQRCLTEWVAGAAYPRPRETHAPAYVLITEGCEDLGLQHQETS